MKRSPLIVFTLTLPLASSGEEAFYQGLIGERIGVSIEVPTSAGETQGTIRYDSSGSDELSLDVTNKPKGSFEWKESLYSRESDSTKHTGTFIGTLSPDGKLAEGTWKTPDGKQGLPFKLSRVAQLSEIKSKEIDASVSYPQFDAEGFRKLNERLTEEAKQTLSKNTEIALGAKKELQQLGEVSKETIEGISRASSCDIEFVRQDLVSLQCMVYDYSGGAHPNTEFFARNYATGTNGAPREIGLWDLLQKSPKSVNQISNLLIDDLKRQKASSVTDGSIKDFSKELNQDALPFSVIPAGLAFQFSPYAVASYAEGSFRVVISNKDIIQLYRRDGPLADRSRQQ